MCRKQDLLQIADHYQTSVSRQALKKEIKSRVLQHLSELNVLQTISLCVKEVMFDENKTVTRIKQDRNIIEFTEVVPVF